METLPGPRGSQTLQVPRWEVTRHYFNSPGSLGKLVSFDDEEERWQVTPDRFALGSADWEGAELVFV